MKKKSKKYIEHLHGKDIYNELLLLEEIYLSTAGISTKTLIEILHVERRSLYKYIEHINDLGSKISEINCIKLNKKKDYIFIGDKSVYFNYRFAIIEQSPAISLAKKFIVSSKINFIQFAMDSYLSESTIRRKIQTANYFLEKYNIKILIRSNEILLTGDEVAIRHGLISFFWWTYRDVKWPFDHIQKETLLKQIAFITDRSDLTINSKIQNNQILYVLAVTIGRINQKKLISEKYIQSFDIFFDNIFFEIFLKNYTLNTKISIIEIKFLYLLLLSIPEYYLKIDLQQFLNIFENYKGFIDFDINDFFIFIEEKHPKWERYSENNNKFFCVLYSGIMAFYLFQGKSFSLDNFALQYKWHQEFPNLSRKIKSFIKKQNPIMLEEEINSLTHIYTRSYMMIFPPHDFEPEIIILLDTDMPIYVEQYISFTLYNILSSKFNVSFYLPFELEKEPDLIFTTSPISSNNSIFIDQEISDKDILTAYTACEKIRNRKNNFFS